MPQAQSAGGGRGGGVGASSLCPACAAEDDGGVRFSQMEGSPMPPSDHIMAELMETADGMRWEGPRAAGGEPTAGSAPAPPGLATTPQASGGPVGVWAPATTPVPLTTAPTTAAAPVPATATATVTATDPTLDAYPLDLYDGDPCREGVPVLGRVLVPGLLAAPTMATALAAVASAMARSRDVRMAALAGVPWELHLMHGSPAVWWALPEDALPLPPLALRLLAQAVQPPHQLVGVRAIKQ
jgi:hypothetical protein